MGTNTGRFFPKVPLARRQIVVVVMGRSFADESALAVDPGNIPSA